LDSVRDVLVVLPLLGVSERGRRPLPDRVR